MNGDVLSVERVIAAPPEAIFALVADAGKHPLIDGSGSVKQVQEGAPERLSLGSTFGMDMKVGVNYSMVSEVVEFEDNRRIAWQSKPARSGRAARRRPDLALRAGASRRRHARPRELGPVAGQAAHAAAPGAGAARTKDRDGEDARTHRRDRRQSVTRVSVSGLGNRDLTPTRCFELRVSARS